MSQSNVVIGSAVSRIPVWWYFIGFLVTIYTNDFINYPLYWTTLTSFYYTLSIIKFGTTNPEELWFSQWWCSRNLSILCHKDLKEESRPKIKSLLSSTLQIEAQASRDDLDTDHLHTKYKAES